MYIDINKIKVNDRIRKDYGNEVDEKIELEKEIRK